MFVIKNKTISLGVNQIGAELASIKNLTNGLEYIWEGHPEYWSRHSCILFPVIGCVRNDHVNIDGKQYPMIKHGLVRNQSFDMVYQDSNNLRFQFKSNDWTKLHYPYEFSLVVHYRLVNTTVTVTYEVTTSGDRPMPFNIGAHPAFRCPLFESEKRSDYTLEFSHAETQFSPVINTQGLITDETQDILYNKKSLPITDSLFERDALILSNLNSSEVTLVSGSGLRLWTFHFEGFPYLGIWSKNASSPFVCIEPWYGMADQVNGAGPYSSKPGIQEVAPEEVWRCAHQIDIHI